MTLQGEDGGSIVPRNSGILPQYMASQPRRLQLGSNTSEHAGHSRHPRRFEQRITSFPYDRKL
jgi:hypothetical protein